MEPKVNHPAASVSVATRNFFGDAATPPCGDAVMQGGDYLPLDPNSFTTSITADDLKTMTGHRPALQCNDGYRTEEECFALDAKQSTGRDSFDAVIAILNSLIISLKSMPIFSIPVTPAHPTSLL